MTKKLFCMFLTMTMALSIMMMPQTASAAAETYAEPANASELEKMNDMTTQDGIGFRIIDGQLYEWGSNGFGRLGITAREDGTTINVDDVVKEPVKVERSVFGGSDVIKVLATTWCTFVITAAGELYGAGYNDYRIVNPNSAEINITQYSKIDIDGKKVLEINGTEAHANVAVKVQETDGSFSWYAWGWNSYGQCLNGLTQNLSVPTKVDLNMIPGKTIKEIAPGFMNVMLLTTDDLVYMVGYNDRGTLGNGSDKTTVALQPVAVTFPENDVVIEEIRSCVTMVSARDTKGRVWTWGHNGAGGIGNGTTTHQFTPYLAMGAGSENENTLTKKAVRLFTRHEGVAVLCSDNTIWAWGLNRGNAIDPAGGNVVRPTQVFADVSKKETIANYIDYIDGIGVMTRSGDLYYLGSNTNASLGNGTTTAPPAGESAVAKPEGIPPLKPTTKNGVTIDIQYIAADGSTRVIKGDGDASSVNVKAGQKFTAQIYFDDYAKLDSFILPISFTKDFAQIVYKAGAGDSEYKKYPTTGGDRGITVTTYGASTGLRSYVNDSIWMEGQLIQNEYYPKLSNAGGFFSIAGRTTKNNAGISGRQMMASVDFIGTGDGTVDFKIMSAEDSAGADANYDPLVEGIGANWTIVDRDATGTNVTGTYTFDEFHVPSIEVKTVPLISMGLNLVLNKEGKDYPMTDKYTAATGAEPAETRSYYVVDRRNSDNTYIINTLPNPADASFADVTWSVEFDDFSAVTNPADKQVSDFINQISNGPKAYTFKTGEVDKMGTDDAYIKITASRPDVTIEPIYIKITTLEPPEAVAIQNKQEFMTKFAGAVTQYNGDESMLGRFVTADGANSTFPFQAAVTAGNSKNLNVTWSAYHCKVNDDGTMTETAIAEKDKSAPAVAHVLDDDGSLKQASAVAQRTTADGSFVRLRVQSVIDSTVGDYIDFRVELQATSIVTDDAIYMAQESTRLLNISAEPFDAYNPEYEMVYEGSTDAEHGPYITFNEDTGMITSMADTNDPFDETIYDKIKITEKKSGITKEVKVYVLKIIEPPNMDVKAVNNVGVNNDRIYINQDLKVGDNLKIFKTFMDTNEAVEYPSLTATDIALLSEDGYTISGGLDPLGGSAGYLVERPDSAQPFTQVPVNYSPEPCKLTGFVYLEGKWPGNEANSDIYVEIKGLRDENGNPVQGRFARDNGINGYFEFDQYIPVGTYIIEFSKNLYITRDVQVTLTNNKTEAVFEVSTADNPIYLAPGDLINRNRKEDPAEFNQYQTRWFGKIQSRGDLNFPDYNFVETSSNDNRIDLYDLNLLLKYYNRSEVYQDWNVTH